MEEKKGQKFWKLMAASVFDFYSRLGTGMALVKLPRLLVRQKILHTPEQPTDIQPRRADSVLWRSLLLHVLLVA